MLICYVKEKRGVELAVPELSDKPLDHRSALYKNQIRSIFYTFLRSSRYLRQSDWPLFSFLHDKHLRCSLVPSSFDLTEPETNFSKIGKKWKKTPKIAFILFADFNRFWQKVNYLIEYLLDIKMARFLRGREWQLSLFIIQINNFILSVEFKWILLYCGERLIFCILDKFQLNRP